jgi:outer membrane protein
MIRITRPLTAAMALGCFTVSACADDIEYSTEVGIANTHFSVKSGELEGPAGTTPPGVTVGVDDVTTEAFEANAKFSNGFGVSLVAGLPPILHFRAEGTAADLGVIGSARAWLPAIVVTHTLPGFGIVHPFVGLGLNHSSFTSNTVYDNYTEAFGGTSTHSSLSPRFGAVGKIGADFPLTEKLFATLAYSRYTVRTTATVTTDTTGVGPIVRQISVRADPNIVALLLGYRF